MSRLQAHIRNTFLAGIFASVPLAVTVFIVWWLESKTRPLAVQVLHVDLPFLGVVLALAVIYGVGLVVRSVIGRFFLSALDGLLIRIPVLKQLYRAWKQVALVPGGEGGVFSRVVLIPDETGLMRTLGFSTGVPLVGDPTTTLVFVPAAPNPTSGRLYFVPAGKVRRVEISTEEAFKIIVSGGNYIPPQVAEATARG